MLYVDNQPGFTRWFVKSEILPVLFLMHRISTKPRAQNIHSNISWLKQNIHTTSYYWNSHYEVSLPTSIQDKCHSEPKETFRESFTVKIRVATTESETSSSREEKALIVLLRVHCEPLFSSYGCWHLKPQLSSSSWDARGGWKSCRWDWLPTSWPTSSTSSMVCRVSSSSWCTASSASRYHYLTPPQDSSNPHSSLWADPEHDLLLQVQKQYKIRFKGIKKKKTESEEYTLSSRAMSEPSKHSEVKSCISPEHFTDWFIEQHIPIILDNWV